MRAQRSGDLTTRRMEDTPASIRVRAITSLAAIMKSSISLVARFACRALMSRTSELAITGSASIRSKSMAPSRCRWSLRAVAASFWSFSCACKSADAATFGGAGAADSDIPSNQAPTPLYVNWAQCRRNTDGKFQTQRFPHPHLASAQCCPRGARALRSSGHRHSFPADKTRPRFQSALRRHPPEVLSVNRSKMPERQLPFPFRQIGAQVSEGLPR